LYVLTCQLLMLQSCAVSIPLTNT